MPAKEMLLAVYGEPPGGYGIAVVDRYVTADPAIQPDRFEDDDTCAQADANSAVPDKQIDPTGPFTDTLTIDNPYEVDWLRFTVPGPDSTLLTIRTAARPLGPSDSSNIGLFLRQARRSFDFPIQAHAKGSAESLSLFAEPGDYYLAIVDEAGVATRYSVCIGLTSACPLIGASAKAAP
jgi:hypothetical protein